MLNGKLKAKACNGKVYGAAILQSPSGLVLIKAKEKIVGESASPALTGVITQILDAAEFFPLKSLIGKDSFKKAIDIYVSLKRGDVEIQKKAMLQLNKVIEDSRSKLIPEAQDIDYALARLSRYERDKVSGDDFVIDGFGYSPTKLKENMELIGKKSRAMKTALSIYHALISTNPKEKALGQKALAGIKKRMLMVGNKKEKKLYILIQKKLKERKMLAKREAEKTGKPKITPLIIRKALKSDNPKLRAAGARAILNIRKKYQEREKMQDGYQEQDAYQDSKEENYQDNQENYQDDFDNTEEYIEGRYKNDRAIIIGLKHCIGADMASKRRIELLGNNSTTIGFSFKKLFSSAGKKLKKMGGKVAKVVPGAGTILQTADAVMPANVKKAMGLIKSARELDPTSIKKIKTIKTLAKAGLPEAQNAVKAIKTAQVIQNVAEQQLMSDLGPPISQVRPIPVKIVEWAK